MTIKNPVNSMFSKLGKVLPYALLRSKDESFNYQCLISSIEDYKEGNTYSIYQVTPILRLIGKKLDLFTKKLQEKIQNEDSILAVVITWEEKNKEVFLLSCEQQDLIDEGFVALVEETKIELKNWVSKNKQSKTNQAITT